MSAALIWTLFLPVNIKTDWTALGSIIALWWLLPSQHEHCKNQTPFMRCIFYHKAARTAAALETKSALALISPSFLSAWPFRLVFLSLSHMPASSHSSLHTGWDYHIPLVIWSLTSIPATGPSCCFLCDADLSCLNFLMLKMLFFPLIFDY